MLLLLLQLQPKTKYGLLVLVAANRCANRYFQRTITGPAFAKIAPGVLKDDRLRAGQKQRRRRNANDLEYKS